MKLMDILGSIADAVGVAIAKIPPEKRGEDICMGADGTLTSQIDKVAENTVLDYIDRNGIALNVLSEEIGFVDNGAEETLVLDPIDGTSNAIAGVPMFTISMAVGTKTLSDVRIAYLKNMVTGDVMTAEKGKGAYKNGVRVHARKQSCAGDLFMMIYMGNGAHPDAFALAKRVCSSRSYGCASLEMALVAEGKADGYLMYAENYARAIRVVDIAASYLILKEAGGDVLDLDGNPLDMPFELGYRANFIAFGDRKVYDFVMKKENSLSKRRYGINVNMSIPDAKAYAKRVMDALEGEDYVLDAKAAEAFGMKGQPLDEMKADVLIAIGGDGTILRALMKSDIPIIGVNAGGVGFLAEIDVKDIETGIARMRRGEYTIEERSKIAPWYNGAYLSIAVNEVVVHTDTVAKIRHFRVYVNDQLMTEVRADGIIVSTPTGSTCYAMSLGAPIIDPRVDALVIVPMAAYKFASRPFVVPINAKVTVEAVMDKGCLIVVDGQEEYVMEGHTSIDITVSKSKARFVKFDMSFYKRVRDKLVNAI